MEKMSKSSKRPVEGKELKHLRIQQWRTHYSYLTTYRPILPVAEKHLVVILRIRGVPPDMKSTLADDQNLNFLPIIHTKMLLPDE